MLQIVWTLDNRLPATECYRMENKNRRTSRLIKFFVRLAAVFTVIAAIFVVVIASKIWFAIGFFTTSKGRIADSSAIRSPDVKTRFVEMLPRETPHVAVNHAEEKSPAKVAKAVKTGSVSLVGMKSLMSAELGPLRLCDLDCAAFGMALGRIKGYSNGRFDTETPPALDPAFQLALRLYQAGLGPPGRAVFETIYEFEKKPSSFNSALSLSKLLWKVDSIAQSIQERGRGPALESDALMELLKTEALSCTNASWARKCLDFEHDIKAWIDEGALL